jgi:hypothetical protein
LVEWRGKRRGEVVSAEEEDLGKGNLFATGLVAGGALMGVIVAFLSAGEGSAAALGKMNVEHGLTTSLGENGYEYLGVLFFAVMAFALYKIGRSKHTNLPDDLPMEGNVQ